ncbi:MAG: hypothetical protein PHO44_03515 [Sphaerochaetaceae bacterium]|jgi:hypothetical protein|nr:hypothetical protein [Sphaerochaetaceae bacterium]MDD3162698.1 hypothetical protein [Sphaerochaetaceae bacterium]MDD4007028.1 hypothetical protein [Sphaerochaetaceae bacterium]
MRKTLAVLALTLISVFSVLGVSESDAVLQASSAAASIAYALVPAGDVQIETSASIENGRILAVIAITYQGRSAEFNVMALASDSDITEAARKQLEYDIPEFLFSDDLKSRIDYVSGTVISYKAIDENIPSGTCFKASNGAILLARSYESGNLLLDRFWAPSIIPGLMLEKRSMLVSVWGYGALHSSGAGCMIRIPGLYPLSAVVEAGYAYSGKALIQAGLAIELPLSLISGSSFFLLANSRIIADAKAGVSIASGGSAAFCASAGIYYDVAFSRFFSVRAGYERRFDTAYCNEVKLCLVWNI